MIHETCISTAYEYNKTKIMIKYVYNMRYEIFTETMHIPIHQSYKHYNY